MGVDGDYWGISVGHAENSPAFQRWVWMSCEISPVGTADLHS